MAGIFSGLASEDLLQQKQRAAIAAVEDAIRTMDRFALDDDYEYLSEATNFKIQLLEEAELIKRLVAGESVICDVDGWEVSMFHVEGFSSDVEAASLACRDAAQRLGFSDDGSSIFMALSLKIDRIREKIVSFEDEVDASLADGFIMMGAEKLKGGAVDRAYIVFLTHEKRIADHWVGILDGIDGDAERVAAARNSWLEHIRRLNTKIDANEEQALRGDRASEAAELEDESHGISCVVS